MPLNSHSMAIGEFDLGSDEFTQHARDSQCGIKDMPPMFFGELYRELSDEERKWRFEIWTMHRKSERTIRWLYRGSYVCYAVIGIFFAVTMLQRFGVVP